MNAMQTTAVNDEQRKRQRAELERLERQMIPLLNSVRQQLGKPPVIVPKVKAEGRGQNEHR
jgi:hypothetical protein